MECLIRDGLPAVPASWWVPSVVVAGLVAVLYCVMRVPIDWTKDLCDVGFDPPTRGWLAALLGPGRRARAAYAREALRKRRIAKMPPVYPNGWFGVLESCRLPRGGVEYVAVLGQELAVFRGQAGAVHVLDAYCPHMGANMAVGGRVHGDCLVCPFHEWSFDGRDGACASVPYSEKVPDFARVRRWETFEANGYIFVWHHAEGEAPSWWPRRVPAIEDGSWTYVGRNEFLVSCHIQDIPENAADFAHLSAIHGPGMVGRALSRHLWHLKWTAGGPDQPHVGTLNLNHQLELFGFLRSLKMDVCAKQMGPGYVELDVQTQLGPIAIVQSVTPVEPMLQRVIHRMHCPPLLVPFAKLILYGENIMFERDIEMWNRKQFVDKPILVKEERYISRYRRWFSQFYSANSPKHTFRKDTMEW